VDSPPTDNRTDFELHPQMLLTRTGEKLVAVLKATFELVPETGELVLAPKKRARPVRMSDEPWGEPEIASIKYPCDLVPTKPGTDVLFVGSAYAPNGEPTPFFDAYLSVGPVKKAIRVSGLRVWESSGAGLSSPRPLTSLEVRYDFAWGGIDQAEDGRLAEEPRNPVGRGIAVSPSSLTHQQGPQIEDPDNLIRSFKTAPQPVSLGPTGRNYAPRRSLSGTFDESWKELRSPLPPLDEQDGFYTYASPGLLAVPFLIGDEVCALLNLVPQGAVRFALPGVRPEFEFRAKRRSPETVRPPLDTVIIDSTSMEEGGPLTVELVWRASVPAPRKMKDSLLIVKELV